MGYSTKSDVEFWGQFQLGDLTIGYDYNNSIAKAITIADRMIDHYCQVPESFFVAGGIEIQQEYHNGTDVAYLGGITKFFNWYSGGTSHLKFKHKPVLSVTKLEEETSADSWTTRTEGTGNDYIVVDDGVRFVKNTPSWKYKNVRATYKAGYAVTPSQVVEVSGRLAAALLQKIDDAKTRQSVTTTGLSVSAPATPSLTGPVFTDELKSLLVNYRRVVYAFT
jgi:hypothetical protein